MSVDFGKEGVSQKTKTFGRKKERKKEILPSLSVTATPSLSQSGNVSSRSSFSSGENRERGTCQLFL